MKPVLNTQYGSLAVCIKVVEALKPLFEGSEKELDKVGSVERYRKRFDTKEDVKANVTRRGCINVACLNVKNARKESGYIVGNAQFVAFVMTDDHFGKNRSQRAEVIASRLVNEVLKPSFSQSLGKFAHKPVDSASAQNLTTNLLDDIAVALWAVSWQQECRLNVPLDVSALDDFLTLGLTVEQSDGAPLQKSEIKLPQGKPNETN